MGCYSTDELSRFLGHWELPDDRVAFEQHIRHCAECRQKLKELSLEKNLSRLRSNFSHSTQFEPAHGLWYERVDFGGNRMLGDVDQAETVAKLPEIARLDVVRLLGFGGVGTVYEAFDPQLRRPVAVKLLRMDPSPE